MGETLHILEKIEKDAELYKLWNCLSEEKRQELREVDEGIRVPNLLCDTVFKHIFDPDVNGERLSRFVSSILDKEVKVLHSLGNEGFRYSVYSKGVILDIVVQFADGSIGNVEIQRMGIEFPSKRAAVYSADLVSKQYAILRGEKKEEVDYDNVKPVYTIVIMEHSSSHFRKSTEYIHHFRQKSDTGVELELVQYYDYVCLDKFKKKNPRVASELEKWLKFLTIWSVEEMNVFLEENPEFQSLYESAIMMTKDRRELLSMLSEFFEKEDIIASLNKTNESMIKRMKREITELQDSNKEKDKVIGEKDKVIDEKDLEIRQLREALRKNGIEV